MRTLLIVIVAWFGLGEAAKWPERNGVPCGCSRLHRPVCGHDNVDYPNPGCAISCGQVSGYREGTCDSPALCGCPFSLQPVCARRPNGVLDTFDNRCVAECDTGARVVSEGPCESSGPPVKKAVDEDVCVCTLNYSPVCGLKDGKWTTYGNACAANCAKAEKTKDGACGRSRGCPCGRIYLPLCARKPDGTLKSYPNKCEADCEDAEKEYDGECRASPDNSLPGPYKVKRDGECSCSRHYKPVCAFKHGQWANYTNICLALCNGRPERVREHACPPPIAAQLPVLPDPNLRPSQLPVFPDPNLKPAQLPVFPDGKRSAAQRRDYPDLEAAQLPVIHDDDSSDEDIWAAQLPALPDDDESSEERLVASQLPVFPDFFRNMFQ